MASAALNKFMEWVKENHAKQPSLGAELRAMGREAVKDVRATLHEVAWGQPEHFSEPGAPLSPTPQLVTADLTGKAVDREMDR